MTYEEKIDYMRELFDNLKVDDAWQLFKDTVLDYVTSTFWCRKMARGLESSLLDYRGETYIHDKQKLFLNEYTRPLFETWIEKYYRTYKEVKNIFLCPWSKDRNNTTKKVVGMNDYAHMVVDWMSDGKFTNHCDY